jgi:hypothetical protein
LTSTFNLPSPVKTIAGLFTNAEFEAMAEGLLTEAELDAIIQTLITTGRYCGSLTLEQVEQLNAKFPAIRDSKSCEPDVTSVESTPKADQGLSSIKLLSIVYLLNSPDI